MNRKKVADSEELVVLVDEKDRELGVMSKSQVHGKDTPLHRAFSVFIFRSSHTTKERQVMNEVLVQQRAFAKKTWPGVWSNSCCGHPMPHEGYEEAIRRRVKYELGCELRHLKKVSDYRYRFERDGVVENEVCPVYTAELEGEIQRNSDEVEEVRWVGWEKWLEELRQDRDNVWSEWCKEEAELVRKYNYVHLMEQ